MMTTTFCGLPSTLMVVSENKGAVAIGELFGAAEGFPFAVRNGGEGRGCETGAAVEGGLLPMALDQSGRSASR